MYNIQYTHRVLHTILEYAVLKGTLARNPSHGVSLPKPKHKERPILTEQQCGIFLSFANGSRYYGLYYLALLMGMRLSELRGLQWSDIDWIKGTIQVRRQAKKVPGLPAMFDFPKTNAGSRTLILSTNTLKVLQNQKENNEMDKRVHNSVWKENNLIFPSTVGTPFTTSHLYDDFFRILISANLPKIRFHDLRHTAASNMLNNRIPLLVVSKILGHSSPSVTANIYGHISTDMQEEVMQKMEELITPTQVGNLLKDDAKNQNSALY